MKAGVVFYQQYPLPYFGLLSMMGFMKNNGIDSDVIVAALEPDPIAALASLKPSVVGVPVMTVEHRWLLQTVRDIRRVLPAATIVVGGVHAVLYPEAILGIPQVDLVCTGDGEQVMVDIMRELGRPAPAWDGVEGIGYREASGGIRINSRARLFAFRDEVMEDRTIYYKRYPLLARDTAKRFIASRGCPYTCNFCYNEQLREIFRDSGPYVRRKSVESLIREIRLVTERYTVSAVFFVDDLFTMDKTWLRDFLARYAAEVAIPFMCTTRANVMDDERAAMLAQAGCRTVSFGVESGNYEIRKIVLNKDISDESIVRCGRLVKQYGMKVQTANMFCLPGETLDRAFETIELNIRAGTDFAFASLLMPFPKTAIADYCIQRGYLKPDYSFGDMPESFMTQSMLALPDKDRIINVQRLAYFFVRSPWFYRHFRGLVNNTRLRRLFDALFAWSNFLRHKDERGVSFAAAFRYAWRMRKTF